MKNFLIRVFCPAFWNQSYPSNKEYDRWVNEQLDAGTLELDDDYTARLGGKLVWIRNYPYAFGRLYEPSLYLLPLPQTRRRLYRAYLKLVLRDLTTDANADAVLEARGRT